MIPQYTSANAVTAMIVPVTSLLVGAIENDYRIESSLQETSVYKTYLMVTIGGNAKNAAERDFVANLAEDNEGVKKVDNDTTIIRPYRRTSRFLSASGRMGAPAAQGEAHTKGAAPCCGHLP